MQLLGWCASTAPPASAALPSRPPDSPAAGRDERRSGPVHGPSRPRSVSVLGGSRRRRGLDHGGLADSEGSPGPAPVCGPPGGPNQGRVGGARKAESETRSRREAWRLHLLLEFLLPLQFRGHDPGAARCLRSVASVERPYSGRVRWATRGPPASAAAHSGRQGESVPHSGSQPGVSTPLRVTARECQS